MSGVSGPDERTRERRYRLARARILLVLAAAALVLTTVVMVLCRHGGLPLRRNLAVANFAVDLLVVAGLLVGLGKAVTNDWAGIALSARNKYSLSRVQMAGWTAVVGAAVLCIAKLNLIGFLGAMPGGKDALEITVPGELLAALGIASFSTAVVPAVLAMKAGQSPTADQAADGRQRQAEASGAPSARDVTNHGKVVANTDPQLARWLDILTGDELANAGTVDLSKVQQALVTVLLLGAYAFLVASTLAAADGGIAELPPLSASFIGLLAVSHAGYLGYKAMPKDGGGASTAPAPGPAAVSGTAPAFAFTIGAAPAPPRS